jgi:hypothetical protein
MAVSSAPSKNEAVDKLSNATSFDAEGAQKWAHWREGDAEQVQ